MVTTTFCVSGAVIAKAGAGRNTDVDCEVLVGTDTAIDTWITQAESRINAASRYNWTDAYASLNADTKKILEDAASCIAATYAIAYDMSGYTSLTEAAHMINVYIDSANKCISLLRDKDTQRFVADSTTGTI